MNQSPLVQFGDSKSRVEKALEALRQGQGVLLVDDEDRENEGDLIFSSDHLTAEQMALMIREGSGIVCLCLTPEKVEALGLPMMVADNTSRNGTGFTVSIEAKEGVTTGVSAVDRVQTVKVAVASDATADDLCRPGHVFPLKAQEGGVLVRRGHTEGTVDLMRMAGLTPSGLLCELTNPDGTMARLPGVVDFAKNHDMVVLTIEDLASYREAQMQAEHATA